MLLIDIPGSNLWLPKVRRFCIYQYFIAVIRAQPRNENGFVQY